MRLSEELRQQILKSLTTGTPVPGFSLSDIGELYLEFTKIEVRLGAIDLPTREVNIQIIGWRDGKPCFFLPEVKLQPLCSRYFMLEGRVPVDLSVT